MHPLWLSACNISWTVSSHWTCFGALTLSHFLVTVLFTCYQSNFDQLKIFCGYSILSMSLISHRAGIWDLLTQPPTLLRSSLIFWVLRKSGWNPSSIIPSILVNLCVCIVSRAFDTIVGLLSESLTLLSIWALITALNPLCFPAKPDGTLRRVFCLLWHFLWISNCLFPHLFLKVVSQLKFME